MARKPENTFIASINRHLKETYFEKTNNPFRSGIADCWYSGTAGDLWVEYKFIESLPRSAEIAPDLSARQVRWLQDRHNEGRNVAVILGCREGGIIYRDLDWEKAYPAQVLRARILPRPDVARWIFEQVGRSPCRLSEP